MNENRRASSTTTEYRLRRIGLRDTRNQCSGEVHSANISSSKLDHYRF